MVTYDSSLSILKDNRLTLEQNCKVLDDWIKFKFRKWAESVGLEVIYDK